MDHVECEWTKRVDPLLKKRYGNSFVIRSMRSNDVADIAPRTDQIKNVALFALSRKKSAMDRVRQCEVLVLNRRHFVRTSRLEKSEGEATQERDVVRLWEPVGLKKERENLWVTKGVNSSELFCQVVNKKM
jgi:RecA-family ATPase